MSLPWAGEHLSHTQVDCECIDVQLFMFDFGVLFNLNWLGTFDTFALLSFSTKSLYEVCCALSDFIFT